MSCCGGGERNEGCDGLSKTAGASAMADEASSLLSVAEDLEAPVPPFVPGTVNVAERLGLASLEITASKAVSIEGSNAVRVDVMVVNMTLGHVAIRVQVSNDAVCWSDAAQFRKRTSGYATTKVRGIGFRFVRLFYEASNTAGGQGVLAASLHHWRN